MKLSEFKKLEESIKEQDFSLSFKNINRVMFFLSIFGHIASIFLAFFLVSKILSGAITNNQILVTISSIILLGGLELLKREIFDKFSLQHIKNNSFIGKDVLPLTITSLFIVSLSFYASIKGAKEFAAKSDQIDTQVQATIKTYEDSVKTVYNTKIIGFENEIKLNKDLILQKDNEQTEIEGSTAVPSQKRSRIQDLKSEKKGLIEQNNAIDIKIKETKEELNTVIRDYENKVLTEGKNKKEQNENNTFFFVMISTLIELIILAGVYFNEYYKWRSYNEFKDKIENDVSFQKWINYNKMLDIIYVSGYSINDRVPPYKLIIDLCKINGIVLNQKDLIEVFKLFISLGIIRSSGNARYIVKSKESAQDSLKNYFKID